jgi:hypothetical protein
MEQSFDVGGALLQHGGSPPAPHRSADSENFFSVLKA